MAWKRLRLFSRFRRECRNIRLYQQRRESLSDPSKQRLNVILDQQLQVCGNSNPAGANFPCKSLALPWSFRHAIVGGTAGAVTQALFSDYKVFQRGVAYADTMGQVGNRVYGSYQGKSTDTMGQLVAGTVTSGTLVKPTAAIPANTSLVANLPNSLGGRIYEQLTGGLAANVDAIFRPIPFQPVHLRFPAGA